MHWVKAKKFREARQIVNRLEAMGISFELTNGESDFDVRYHRLDERGEYVPIPSAVLQEIGGNHDLILEGLRSWQRSREAVMAIWWQHDTGGYREECERHWRARVAPF